MISLKDKNHNNRKRRILTPLLAFTLTMLFHFLPAAAQTPDLKIHLRGVYESKISLIPLAAPNALKTIRVIERVKKGGTITLDLPAENLPGEFVVRFDYRENILSTPYPSEKRIIVGDQNLEMWVHPAYLNNPDSTWFQKDEKENTVYSSFNNGSSKQKKKLGLLQNLLLNYDDNESKFYKSAVKEYEKRRKVFNIWIKNQTTDNKDLFVSSLFGFQLIPQIKWDGSEADRKKSLITNYFEGMDFSDSILIKTSGLKEWMDGYVNLYGESAASVALRDSLFTLAGKTAVEKAKNGHPLVYGWMVDYFFNGYESFNIQKGIQMLQPYLEDPLCLTAKRQQIEKRLKGIASLVPGTIAPEINMTDNRGIYFDLHAYQSGKKFLLLLFWSADCSQCRESAGTLYPWSQDKDVLEKAEIVAISLDETETEISAWERSIQDLPGWRHLRANEGLRSDVANDYYIIGIPVMVLLDAKTKEIIGLPDNAEQLNEYMISK
jgi:thioredoxin-related protein